MEPNSSRLYTVGRDTNSSNSSAYYASRPEVTAGRKLIKTTGSLEIIEGTDSGMCGSFDSSVDSRPSSSASPRPWSRGSVGAVPPRADSSMSRKVYTPTKQIALQAVRRKEESSEPFVDHIDWKSTNLDTSHRRTWDWAEEGGQGDAARAPAHIRQDFDVEPSQHATKLRLPIPDQTDEQQMIEKRQRNDAVRTMHKVEMNAEEKQRDNDDNKEEKDDEDDDDDDESDSSDDEEDERKAPNELLMEFVDCLMKKDFQTASKLCKMILLYEPENAEALKFQPLIEEKLTLDAEAAKEAEEEGSGDEDDDEDDSDDDDDDDDSDDDDDDTNSDEESSDNDNDDINAGGDNNSQNAPNNGRNVEPGHRPPHYHRADSGIASDTEHGN